MLEGPGAWPVGQAKVWIGGLTGTGLRRSALYAPFRSQSVLEVADGRAAVQTLPTHPEGDDYPFPETMGRRTPKGPVKRAREGLYGRGLRSDLFKGIRMTRTKMAWRRAKEGFR